MGFLKSIFGIEKTEKHSALSDIQEYHLRETELPLEVHNATIRSILMKQAFCTEGDVNPYASNEIIIYLDANDSEKFSVTFIPEEGKGKYIEEAAFYEDDDLTYFERKGIESLIIKVNEPDVTISGFSKYLEKITISAKIQKEFFKVRDTYIKKITFVF